MGRLLSPGLNLGDKPTQPPTVRNARERKRNKKKKERKNKSKKTKINKAKK